MERSGKTSHPRGPGRRAATDPQGRLLLVVDAHDGGSALIVSAVRRRCSDVPDLEFARRVTTRPDGPRDAEGSISRREFRDAERAGSFLATWSLRGHRFGLPAKLRDVLAAGRTVVAAAPASIVADIRSQWPDVRIIRVMAEIDAARRPLEPRQCLARMLGATTATHGPVRPAFRVDASINCANDAPAAVRLLTEALLRLRVQVPAVGPAHRRSRPTRSARAGGTRRAALPSARA